MTVSEHAIEQYFLKVSNCPTPKPETVEKIRSFIEKAVNNGKEMKLSPKEELKRLLNNHCKEAKYIWHCGVLYVVIDNTVVTCYPKKKKELIEI